MAENKKPSSKRKKKFSPIKANVARRVMELILQGANVPFHTISDPEELNSAKDFIASINNEVVNVKYILHFSFKNREMTLAISDQGYIFMTNIGFDVILPIIMDSSEPDPQMVFAYACEWLTAFTENQVYLLAFHDDEKVLVFFLGPHGIRQTYTYGTNMNHFETISLADLARGTNGHHEIDFQFIPFHILKEDDPEFTVLTEASQLLEQLMDFSDFLSSDEEDDEENGKDFFAQFFEEEDDEERDPQEKNLDSLLDRIERGNRKKGKRSTREKIEPIDVEFSDSKKKK